MSEVEIELPAIKYRMVLPDADTDYIQRGIRDNRAPYERSMLEDMASRLPEAALLWTSAQMSGITHSTWRHPEPVWWLMSPTQN